MSATPDETQTALQHAIAAEVARELHKHHSIRGGSQTTGELLKHLLGIDRQTLQILGAIVAAIWWFAGEWATLQRSHEDVRAVMSTQQQIERKLDDALGLVNEQRMINTAVERNIADIEAQIAAMPTRGEWQALIRQQLVPLRERMERQP